MYICEKFYVSDAMERHKSIFGLLLLFMGLLTSCGEPEVLQAVEEQEVLLKDYHAAMDAMRAKKPQRTNDQTQVTENYGEKGHDRREGDEYFYDEGFSYYTEYDLEIGKLYVLSHDYESDCCILKFYFGTLPIKDVLQFFDNQQFCISFYDNRGNCIYKYDMWHHHIANTGHFFYMVGDPIKIPCIICENCFSINVSFYIYRGKEWLEKSWQQHFYSYSGHHGYN
jgi:hypothetical protein